MNTRFLVLIGIAVVIGFASCKNNDNVFAPVPPSSSLNVVNASADTLGIFLNGTLQNNTAGLVPGSQSFYLPVPSGLQNYQFKKLGSQVVLFSESWNLKAAEPNSVYIYGETADKVYTSFNEVLDTTGIGTGAKIRFVNVSPDAGNLDVSFNNTILFPASAFITPYKFVNIAAVKTAVKVFPAGSSTPALIDTITFQPGFMYTLFSRGLKNGTGNNAFNVGLVINVN